MAKYCISNLGMIVRSCYLIDAADAEADWLEQVVDDMITSRSFFTMAAFFDSEGREVKKATLEDYLMLSIARYSRRKCSLPAESLAAFCRFNLPETWRCWMSNP